MENARASSWFLHGSERCPDCDQLYAYELEVCCVDCDAPICPFCVVTVRAASRCAGCADEGCADEGAADEEDAS